MSRAFLIGAGATKARYKDAPLSDDFLNKLRVKHQGLFNTIGKAVKDIVRQWNQLNGVNIEEVMKLSYELQPSYRDALLQSLYSAIYELLAETTESSEQAIYTYLTGRRITEPPLLRTLLINQQLTPDDFFMTLNYDLYLDREIISVNQAINYGLTAAYMQVESGKTYSAYSLPINTASRYPVYHLHGALNWVKTLNGQKIIIYPGAVLPQYGREGADLCLIPPGMKELNPVLKIIWKNAEQLLLNADELIIIGCSLNPDDKELIGLVHKFRDKKGADKIKIIHHRPDLTDGYIDDTYTAIIGNGHKPYRYGFNLNDPNKDIIGAIEFIFQQ
jgi:hypothetical protein